MNLLVVVYYDSHEISNMLGGDILSTEEDPRPSETLEPNGGSSEVNNSEYVDKEHNVNSSNQDDSELNFKSSDALARGISSMLGTVIRDFDCKAENAAKSQDQLSFAIDRLTGGIVIAFLFQCMLISSFFIR